MLATMKHLVLITALLVGCSKSGSDCATSIGKGMEKFAEQAKSRAPNPEMQQAMTDMAGKLKDTLIKRCTEDKWPSEVVNCFTTASDRPAMQQCQQKLSDEQRDKVIADIRQVMMGGGMKMPPGMAGHPDGLKGAMDQTKDRAQEAAQAAQNAASAAQQAADSATQLAQQAADLAKQIDEATKTIAAAQDEAARKAAKLKLEALQKAKAELDAKISAAPAK